MSILTVKDYTRSSLLRDVSNVILPFHVKMLFSDGYYILQITGLAKSMRMLADMQEPIGQILKKTEVEYLLKNKQHKFCLIVNPFSLIKINS